MNELLKNQRNIFVAISSGILLLVIIWYFGFHQSVAAAYSDIKKSQKSFVSKRNNYRRMESEIINIRDEWYSLNEEFEIVIRRIPDKSFIDNVSNALYNMIKNNGLSIISYSPSNIAIDKKTIILPESEDEIIIEKVPIDITISGSFLNFGKLLDNMTESRYRLTASNIDIAKKNNSTKQVIKFISYAYFQTAVKKEYIAETVKPKSKIKSPKPKEPELTSTNIRPEDAPENIPEWMFEPATEPIVESETTRKTDTQTQKMAQKENLVQKPNTKVNNPKTTKTRVWTGNGKKPYDIIEVDTKKLSPELVGKITETILIQLNHNSYILDDLKFMIDGYNSNYTDVIQLLLEKNTIAYNDNKELYIVNIE
jgi:type IV pilus assembly protein PilO